MVFFVLIRRPPRSNLLFSSAASEVYKGQRSFMLDEPQMKARIAQQPQFIHYLARTDDIDAALASLRYEVGQPSRMTRGELQWRITALGNGRPPESGLLPTIIQWDVPAAMHPSAKLPASPVRLTGLEVHAPASVLARMPLLRSPVPLPRANSACPLHPSEGADEASRVGSGGADIL